MSYARFGDMSDVYLFVSMDGLVCCRCPLDPEGAWVILNGAAERHEHLEAHREAGHHCGWEDNNAVDRRQPRRWRTWDELEAEILADLAEDAEAGDAGQGHEAAAERPQDGHPTRPPRG